MKKGIIILTVLMIFGLTSHQVMAQGSQSDFPQFDGVSLELKNRIEIYPNPAVDYLTVEIKESDLKDTQIILHSIIGNKIVIHPEKILDNNKYRIDVKNLPPGYYLLSVKDPATIFSRTYKFLKRQ